MAIDAKKKKTSQYNLMLNHFLNPISGKNNNHFD